MEVMLTTRDASDEVKEKLANMSNEEITESLKQAIENIGIEPTKIHKAQKTKIPRSTRILEQEIPVRLEPSRVERVEHSNMFVRRAISDCSNRNRHAPQQKSRD